MDAFAGEIMAFGGNYAPVNWAMCQGQTVNVNQYQMLFSLIGSIYGGDGVSTMRFPNLQGQLPVGMGQGPGLSNHVIGQAFGVPAVTVQIANLPPHSHPVLADSSNQAGQPSPAGGFLANTASTAASTGYVTAAGAGTPVAMASQTIGSSGGATNPYPLSNFMPTMAMTMIICVQGLYPTRP